MSVPPAASAPPSAGKPSLVGTTSWWAPSTEERDFTPGWDPEGYRNAKATPTGSRAQSAHPDPAVARRYPLRPSSTTSGARKRTPGTPELFKARATFWLYVAAGPARRSTTEARSGESGVTPVAVFFGVGPEVNLFGLRVVLCRHRGPGPGCPGIERADGRPQAWGIRRQRSDHPRSARPGRPHRGAVQGRGDGGVQHRLPRVEPDDDQPLVDLAHLSARSLPGCVLPPRRPSPARPVAHVLQGADPWACDTVFAASAPRSGWWPTPTRGHTRDSATRAAGPLARCGRSEGQRCVSSTWSSQERVAPVADDLEKVCLARLCRRGSTTTIGFCSLPAACSLSSGCCRPWLAGGRRPGRLHLLPRLAQGPRRVASPRGLPCAAALALSTSITSWVSGPTPRVRVPAPHLRPGDRQGAAPALRPGSLPVAGSLAGRHRGAAVAGLVRRGRSSVRRPAGRPGSRTRCCRCGHGTVRRRWSSATSGRPVEVPASTRSGPRPPSR